MMRFKGWYENDETQERTQAFEKYLQALTALAQKYNYPIAQKYIEHERQYFMTMPIDKLRQDMANLPKYLQEREWDMQRRQQEKEREEKKQAGRLRGYYQVEDAQERIVCSEGDPGFHTKGMPAYPMEQIDPKLKGYYGVHVGSHGWLGILKRDGYCDSGSAYLYTIHCEEMIEDGIKVYIMEDPHVAYRDSSTPDSWIIFSKKKVIPAKYIELDQVVPEDEIEEAPPPYGME